MIKMKGKWNESEENLANFVCGTEQRNGYTGPNMRCGRQIFNFSSVSRIISNMRSI